MKVFPDHRLATCLWCLSVRTGSLIIGYLGAVCYSLAVLLGVLLFVYEQMVWVEEVTALRKKQREDMRLTSTAVVKEITGDFAYLTSQILISTFVFVAGICATMHILFLIGIYKDKASYVKAFSLFMKLSFVCTIVGFIWYGGVSAASEVYLEALVILGGGILILGIHYYVIVIINSQLGNMIIDKPKFQQFT